MIILRLSYAALIGWAGGALLSHGMDTWAVAAFVALAVAHDTLQARESRPVADLIRATRRMAAENFGVAVETLSQTLIATVTREAERSGMDPDKAIVLRRGSDRDITIHAKKDEA